jgi:hypothetical protein
MPISPTDFYQAKLKSVTNLAMNWPVKTAISRVGKGHPTHPVGTRQIHLVCWLGEKEHCGQSISVLALGSAIYKTSVGQFLSPIAAHIMQCHEEVLNGYAQDAAAE